MPERALPPGLCGQVARMSKSPGRQAAMPFIMVTVLLDMMSIGIISPVLP